MTDTFWIVYVMVGIIAAIMISIFPIIGIGHRRSLLDARYKNKVISDTEAIMAKMAQSRVIGDHHGREFTLPFAKLTVDCRDTNYSPSSEAGGTPTQPPASWYIQNPTNAEKWNHHKRWWESWEWMRRR